MLETALMFLALVSGYLLLVEFTTNLTAEEILLFNAIDLAIALVFLCEFAVKLYLAKNRNTYFKSHWWELLAAIPITTDVTQGLRMLRLLKLLHLVEAAESQR